MRQFIITYIIDHKMHYRFWNQVSDTFVDNRHVGVYEVANGLHLPLQLWVHGKVFCLAILIIFSLTERKAKHGLFYIYSEEKNTRHYQMKDFCLLNLELYYQMVTSLSYQTAIKSEKRSEPCSYYSTFSLPQLRKSKYCNSE